MLDQSHQIDVLKEKIYILESDNDYKQSLLSQSQEEAVERDREYMEIKMKMEAYTLKIR